MEKKDERGKKILRPSKNGKNLMIWVFVALGVFYLLNSWTQTLEKPVRELAYSEFFDILKDNPATQKIKSCVKVENIVKGELADGTKFSVNIPENDQDLIRLLRENVREFDIKPPKTLWMNLFYSLGPMVLFILFLWLFAYRGGAAGGGRIWAFGKSRATLASGERLKITFEDVAGVDEA